MAGDLTINLRTISENWRICDSHSPDICETAAVVKADCYGLGMVALAKPLWDAGARVFFVALLQEALALRTVLPHAKIVILHGLNPGDETLYLEQDLIPVLNSAEDIKRANDFSHRAAKQLPVFLHFDTAMNRLGIAAHDAQKIAQDHALTSGLKIDTVMSHFASADEVSSPLNNHQFETFRLLSHFFPKAKKSLANSSGLFRNASYSFDLNRPGMALYGLNPVPEKTSPVAPAIRLDVPVLQIHRAKKGETAGYGATYIFKEDTTLAIAALGYADGLPRSLSNAGYLYWRGYALPIRGRVSMDLTIVDLNAVPESHYPNPGDMLEVIGPSQSADDLAGAAGTIGYEILTALGRRYKRIYV